MERRLLLRLGSGIEPPRTAIHQRLQRHQHHRGLRNSTCPSRRRLEQHLSRQAADRRPAAGNLRKLHRPAQPLGAGHDADPALPLPAAQARSHPAAALLLHVLVAVLALPVSAHDLPLRAALLSLLRSGNLYGLRWRVPGVYARLYDREPDDAELSLRIVPLAVDFRTL